MAIIILLPTLCIASPKVNVKKIKKIIWNSNMAKKREEKNADRNMGGDSLKNWLIVHLKCGA